MIVLIYIKYICPHTKYFENRTNIDVLLLKNNICLQCFIDKHQIIYIFRVNKLS